MTTNAVEIELEGGPAHGRRLVVNGDPMDPPFALKVLADPDIRFFEDLKVVVYKREPSRRDDGPLWVYKYDEN